MENRIKILLSSSSCILILLLLCCILPIIFITLMSIGITFINSKKNSVNTVCELSKPLHITKDNLIKIIIDDNPIIHTQMYIPSIDFYYEELYNKSQISCFYNKYKPGIVYYGNKESYANKGEIMTYYTGLPLVGVWLFVMIIICFCKVLFCYTVFSPMEYESII
jgi:hypothetical protein